MGRVGGVPSLSAALATEESVLPQQSLLLPVSSACDPPPCSHRPSQDVKNPLETVYFPCRGFSLFLKL